MRLRDLFIACAVSIFATGAVSAQVADSVPAQVRDLRRQVTELTRRQAETEALLREISALLQRLEAGGVVGDRCGPGEPTRNQWLQIEISGCAALSANGESISFILGFRNITDDVLYIGAECCYPESWLRVIDDRGQQWQGSQHTVTGLPTNVSKNFLEVQPGSEFSINAVVSRQYSRDLPETPNVIHITLALLRRTEAEQRMADRASTSLGYPDGRPFTVGLARVPVQNR